MAHLCRTEAAFACVVWSEVGPWEGHVFKVKRVAALALWATVVAERLGHNPDLALTLGYAVAVSQARVGGREWSGESVQLLGRQIPVMMTVHGEARAAVNGSPRSASWVRWYLERSFGDNLDEVRATIEAAAASMPPDHLNRVGLQIYEKFQPQAPDCVLLLTSIESAAAAAAILQAKARTRQRSRYLVFSAAKSASVNNTIASDPISRSAVALNCPLLP